jgi:hypothetical protein
MRDFEVLLSQKKKGRFPSNINLNVTMLKYEIVVQKLEFVVAKVGG